MIVILLTLGLALLVLLGSRRAKRSPRTHDNAPDVPFVVLPDPGFGSGTRPEAFAPSSEAESEGFSPGGGDFGGGGSSAGWDDASGGDGCDGGGD